MTFFAFTFCFWVACDPGTRGGCLFHLGTATIVTKTRSSRFDDSAAQSRLRLKELQRLLGCLQMHDAPGPRDQGKWP